MFESFDSDGFTVNELSGRIMQVEEPYVAWQWKANGGTTAQ